LVELRFGDCLLVGCLSGLGLLRGAPHSRDISLICFRKILQLVTAKKVRGLTDEVRLIHTPPPKNLPHVPTGKSRDRVSVGAPDASYTRRCLPHLYALCPSYPMRSWDCLATFLRCYAWYNSLRVLPGGGTRVPLDRAAIWGHPCVITVPGEGFPKLSGGGCPPFSHSFTWFLVS